MHRVKLMLLSALILLSTQLQATNIALADSLRKELSTASTPADSLTLLYNIYDLSSSKNNLDAVRQIYDLAGRMGRTDAQLEMLRYMTNQFAEKDSVLSIILKQAEAFPVSDDQKETVTFIKIKQEARKAHYATAAQRLQRLQQLLSEYSQNRSRNLHANIVQLWTMCTYIGYSSQGDLYAKYMSKLESLLKQLPFRSNALRNAFYANAATVYSYNGDLKKAAAADEELLRIIDQLTRKYTEQGRIYRNYDSIHYLIYRRMLSNAEIIDKDKLQYYYDEILKIRDRDPEVAEDFEKNDRATIYYLIANNEYAEALPLLKKQVKNLSNKPIVRLQMLKALKKAAQETGDDSTLLEASLAYNDVLEEFNELKSNEKYTELQIIYDVNDLKARNAQLEITNREDALKASHNFLILVIVAAIVLLVMLIVVYILYSHARKLSRNLAESNEELARERDHLKEMQEELIEARDQAEHANKIKDEFIDNMSHEVHTPLNAIVGFSQLIVDSVPENRRPELERFTQVLKLNTELLVTLINDALDISTMNRGEMQLDIKPASARSMCEMAIDSVRHKVTPGVKLLFASDEEPDIYVPTDRRRVEQVLINLLDNAAKFTSEGAITLSYIVNQSDNTITFAVTDTGIGIPAEKAEVIFNRFEKLNPYEQGGGLGLHICRLLATLLGGEVRVDTSCNDLTRFIFSIPLQ